VGKFCPFLFYSLANVSDFGIFLIVSFSSVFVFWKINNREDYFLYPSSSKQMLPKPVSELFWDNRVIPLPSSLRNCHPGYKLSLLMYEKC